MLQFGQDTTRLLEEAYLGADFVRRRRASFDAVAPGPGERILDLGCGNGLLTLDLARAVGDAGHVTGLDPSPAMLAAAAARCGDRANLRLVEGTAQALPFDDASLDKAVSVQVFEYFDDLAAPLAELARVLRPGGRAVIADMHFGTLAWHSDRPERMARMLAAYDRHLADPAVPAKLPAAFAAAGFRPGPVTPVTFCDTRMRPDGLARLVLRLMQDFTLQTGEPGPEVVADWAAEQHALAEAGRFFFSVTQFICTAERL